MHLAFLLFFLFLCQLRIRMLRGWLEKGFLIERRVERGEFLPIEVLILSGFGDDFNAVFFCQPLFFVRSVGDQQEIGLFVPFFEECFNGCLHSFNGRVRTCHKFWHITSVLSFFMGYRAV